MSYIATLPGGLTLHVLYISFSMSMLSVRASRVRPFIGFRDYDDHAASTLQTGITTYSGDDADQTYQTTYVEFGGRSDHLTDALARATGADVLDHRVDNAPQSELRYCADLQRNMSAADKPELKVVPAA